MGISLLTMGHGNVKVLKDTIDSFYGIVDEVIYGDLLLFSEDREVIESYKKSYNLKVIKYPFNFLYKNGFSSLLNDLASNASNNMVIYANTSEVIDEDYGMANIIKDNPECNSFFFTHRTEHHRWFRCYDRRELTWKGLIHEELHGEYRPYHKPIFMMKDLEKDIDDHFKSAVLNSAKECVYWNQLIRIADDESLLDGTSEGWLKFAKDTYQSMKDRLSSRQRQVEAFETGDHRLFMLDVYSEYFKNQIFKSNNAIAFQGDKIHLL